MNHLNIVPVSPSPYSPLARFSFPFSFSSSSSCSFAYVIEMWVSVSATIEPQQKQKSTYEPLPPGLRDGKTDLSVASPRELVTGYEPRESCTVPSLTIFVAE